MHVAGSHLELQRKEHQAGFISIQAENKEILDDTHTGKCVDWLTVFSN